MNKKHLGWLAAGVIAAATAAWASGYYPGFPAPTLPLTGNEYWAADTGNAQGINPATEQMSVAVLNNLADPNPRNYLDNGDIAVDQQGTGIITCGTTTVTALQFAADRWFCDANVTSGAARSQVTTTVPAPPAGFTQSVRLYRTSGALLQPVCIMQEVETTRATQLAGKAVIFSVYLQALAGLSSVGSAVQGYIITGTGTDQGLATLTATPAITPAWTGIAGGTSPAAVWNVTTSWVRYNTPSVIIPAAATEVGVEVCFTPAATGAGTTDGIALTGAQLEGGPGSVTASESLYEFRPVGRELADAQRFMYALNEPASGAAVNGFCQALTANTNTCTINLPAQMRGTVPTITIGTAGTFKVNIANTPTTFATPTAGTCSIFACTVTGANTNTAGQAETLTGGGGTGLWTISSDVVM